MTDDGICEVDLFIKDTDVSINQKLMELGLVRTLEEIVIEDTDTENEPGRYMSLSNTENVIGPCITRPLH